MGRVYRKGRWDDLTNVWLGFSGFALKNCGFTVLGSSAGFLEFSLFGFCQQ